jgi:NAD(P)-dependent dehydrogenase (short-subunit alcohol dehydrogenase family)
MARRVGGARPHPRRDPAVQHRPRPELIGQSLLSAVSQQVVHRSHRGDEIMSVREFSGPTAIVSGASRGFGRATAVALAAHGAHVIGVARSEAPLQELEDELGRLFTPEVADVTDPSLPARLFSRYKPQTVVVIAGAVPVIAPLHEQTWQNFSRNWDVDVQHAFNFVRQALTEPLGPRRCSRHYVQWGGNERVAAQRRVRGSQGDAQVP